MKQLSHPWAKLLVLVLIVASAVVLLTMNGLADSPASAPASDDAVHVPAVPTPPPAAIYIGTSSSGVIEDDFNNGVELKFKRNDILRCVPNGNICTWDVFLKGDQIGLSGVNLRDFEVLPNGDILFVIDRKKKLSGISQQVTPRDVIRYHPGGAFSIELMGSTVGLTKTSGNIDALAITPDGHLVISTIGTATINGVGKVHDHDLVEIIGTNGSLYLKGSAIGLTSSDEDIAAAWIGNPSPDRNIYLVTKGSFHVKSINSLSGKKSDIFGCSPGNPSYPIDSCFFYPFFNGKSKGLNKQIDGLSIVTAGPIAQSVVSAALQSFSNNMVVDTTNDDSIDAESFADAMRQGDPELTPADFIDVNQQIYLPMVIR